MNSDISSLDIFCEKDTISHQNLRKTFGVDGDESFLSFARMKYNITKGIMTDNVKL